jgi:cell division protein ZapB
MSPLCIAESSALYWRYMNDTNPKSAVELELKRLEKRLEDLIVTVTQIKEENRALRQRQDTLTAERASLLQKNEQVRGRVEAMIGRLKSMEQA